VNEKSKAVHALEVVEEKIELLISELEAPGLSKVELGMLIGLKVAFSEIIQEINELQGREASHDA